MGRGNNSAKSTATLMNSPRRQTSAVLPIVKAKLYRSGEMYKLNDFQEIVDINQEIDALRPEGHVGRGQGLFCTASLEKASRWVAANLSCRYPHQLNEIAYNGPEPYVYPIKTYERASSMLSTYKHLKESDDPRWSEWEDQARAYWEAGIPLTEFEANQEEILQGEEWSEGYEILIDPESVEKHKPVSWARLIANSPDDGHHNEFKRRQKIEAAEKRYAKLAAQKVA
jgi:hypothetical protein